MALSLGVHAGQLLQVGDSTVKVVSVGPGPAMRLSLGPDTPDFHVSTQKRVEILPDVFVSIGRNANNSPSPRLCFEADKSVGITRLN